MKSNLKNILFVLIFLFLINICSVSAKTWDCPYKYDNGEKYTYRIDNEKGTMVITNAKDEEKYILHSISYNYHIVNTSEEVKSYVDDFCPILFIYSNYNSFQSCPPADSNVQICNTDETYTYTTYTEDYMRNSGVEACVEERDKFCLDAFLSKINPQNTMVGSFFEATLDKDDPLSKDKTTGSNCASWSIFEKKIRADYQEYTSCKSNSCYSHIVSADSEINKLKENCKTILSYRDVYVGTGDDAIEDACVKNCLNLVTNINNIKKEYGIPTSSNTLECGFSEKLIIYIANIIKWIKYIIPVIVIVLGILDFIQAIAADKDDMMKKVQGRFVKRLIAAALIFIIPFIIEFVLDKMGFSSNGCGIIDL